MKIETPNNGIAIIAAGTIPIKVLIIAVKVNAAIISLILIGAINRLSKVPAPNFFQKHHIVTYT